MDAARVGICAGHAESGDVLVGDVELRIERRDLPRRIDEADLALDSLFVRASPRGDFGAEPFQLGLPLGLALGQLSHRRHVVLPVNRSALRASKASAIPNGVARPDSSSGSCASSHADVS